MPVLIANAVKNEMLDALVYRVLGATSPIVEQVMELNPNLAGVVFLSQNQPVILPQFNEKQKPSLKIINIWD